GLPLATAWLALVLTAPSAHAQEPPVARRVLPNGLTVLVRENDAAGVVAVSLQVRAGSGFEAESTAGITNFLHRAMLRGTARRTAVQLATSSEDIGGGLDANGEVETAEVRGQALARHWETLLGLVAEVALLPSLRADEIEKERRLLLGQIKTRADAPFWFSVDAVLRELYGTNPYSRSQLGSKESIERITRADLLAYSTGVLTPYRTGPIFFVAYLGTAPASAAAAEAGVLRELERVREAPVNGDELARAKAYVRGQLAMDRRTNARLAWYMAFFET